MKKILYVVFGILIVLESCGGKPDYKMKKIEIRLDSPHQVNVLFQVVDSKTGLGVPHLSINNFIVMEDQNQIGSEASAIMLPYRKVSNISLKVRTFLVIDNSKSMKDKLDNLKEAAKNLIDISPDFHFYSLYVFSSKLEKLQSFTDDKMLLKKKIDSITIGTSSTNLYGALKDIGQIADYFPETRSLKRIKETNIIVFSDGDDTQGLVDIAVAQKALKNKSVYLIGTGRDLRKGILDKLGTFYALSSMSDLRKTFSKIQQKIEDQANSYYWLIYQSPKRGDRNRTLTMMLKRNHKVYLSVSFNSRYFKD